MPRVDIDLDQVGRRAWAAMEEGGQPVAWAVISQNETELVLRRLNIWKPLGSYIEMTISVDAPDLRFDRMSAEELKGRVTVH